MPEPRKTRSRNLDLQQFAGLGISLAISLMVGAYAGYRLDQWLHTEPFLLITGCLLGLGAGMTFVVRSVLGTDKGRGAGDEPP